MFKDNLFGSWRRLKGLSKVMDWIIFSCQFKARGQAFMGLNSYSFF